MDISLSLDPTLTSFLIFALAVVRVARIYTPRAADAARIAIDDALQSSTKDSDNG